MKKAKALPERKSVKLRFFLTTALEASFRAQNCSAGEEKLSMMYVHCTVQYIKNDYHFPYLETEGKRLSGEMEGKRQRGL